MSLCYPPILDDSFPASEFICFYQFELHLPPSIYPSLPPTPTKRLHKTLSSLHLPPLNRQHNNSCRLRNHLETTSSPPLSPAMTASTAVAVRRHNLNRASHWVRRTKVTSVTVTEDLSDEKAAFSEVLFYGSITVTTLHRRNYFTHRPSLTVIILATPSTTSTM